MEKRKYNSSLDHMQIFALKSAELNKIKGGNHFDDFVMWIGTMFDFNTDPAPDGGVSHDGGPK